MRIFFVVGILLLSVSTVQAQSNSFSPYGTQGYARYMPQQQRQTGPAAVLQKGIHDLRTFLASSNNVNNQAIAGFVETRIAPFFDFAYMTKSALGPTWRRMPPARRFQAGNWLKQNFLEQLAGYVADYRSSRVEVMGSRPGLSRGEMIVPVRVWRRNAPPLSLNFRLYRNNNAWRIFDVSANGQSAIIFYRGYINRMMRRRG